MKGLLKVVSAAKNALPGTKIVRQIGNRTLEEVRLLSEEGGYSYIYVVRDLRSDELFALKRMTCQDADRFALAKREIKVLKCLPKHRHVVEFFGASVEDVGMGGTKEVNILLELCEGGNLLDSLKACNGKLPEKWIISTMIHILLGIRHMHSQDPPIAHRDIKLENVLLSKGSWKLCDFGSASSKTVTGSDRTKEVLRQTEAEVERNTTLMYRPPELVDVYRNLDITEKTDIWMLGCVFYALAFNTHPFQDTSPLAIANARYRIPTDSTRSQKMIDCIHWMLALKPAHRPDVHQLLKIFRLFDDPLPLNLPPEVVAAKAAHDKRNLPNGELAKSNERVKTKKTSKVDENLNLSERTNGLPGRRQPAESTDPFGADAPKNFVQPNSVISSFGGNGPPPAAAPWAAFDPPSNGASRRNSPLKPSRSPSWAEFDFESPNFPENPKSQIPEGRKASSPLIDTTAPLRVASPPLDLFSLDFDAAWPEDRPPPAQPGTEPWDLLEAVLKSEAPADPFGASQVRVVGPVPPPICSSWVACEERRPSTDEPSRPPSRGPTQPGSEEARLHEFLSLPETANVESPVFLSRPQPPRGSL